MSVTRRRLLVGAASTGVAAGLGWIAYLNRRTDDPTGIATTPLNTSDPHSTPGMRTRNFGSTGIRISEVGFGAWAIGGQAYGRVDRAESLNALARAEELGCNFVDTARVYGDSELVLGEDGYGAGMVLVGTKAELMSGRKMSG